MHKNFQFVLPLLLAIPTFWTGCQPANPNWSREAANPAFLHRAQKQITDVMVHDIFSPPVASRIYAYSSIAAYEAMAPGYSDYRSLAVQLNGLEAVPQPEEGKEYCYPLAGVKAMLIVGKQMIFSEDKMDEFEAGLMQEFLSINMPADVYKRSLAYGDSIAKHIINWAGKDNYKQTRTFPKYTITDEEARWKPTPPAYMNAIEPHWNLIRPFTLDSAQQFIPQPPAPYNMKDRNSPFYKEVMEVYQALDVDSSEREERKEIAAFWDCNPYVLHQKGHVMFATKKITPGGHWMGIAQIANKKSNADIMLSAKVYALTGIALADAFISCWDEKYRSELVRPETVINTFIDQNWLPLLQTPPFPEYTSGHAVISTAAAVALTSVFGENFSYIDSVEVEYGLAPRSFSSFMEACNEAAISRLYGGIHYLPACTNGQEQGALVGKHVLQRIKFGN